MDVDEFFKRLIDKLENSLKKTKNEKIISRTFNGNICNELIPGGCEHRRESDEPFTALAVQVKNKKSLEESLQSYIQGEMLDGDNQYMCDKCNKKYDTLKRTSIKTLPNYLIVVLKRFEFDYQTMSRSKVNDYCSFPNSLNMMPYTT